MRTLFSLTKMGIISAASVAAAATAATKSYIRDPKRGRPGRELLFLSSKHSFHPLELSTNSGSCYKPFGGTVMTIRQQFIEFFNIFFQFIP